MDILERMPASDLALPETEAVLRRGIEEGLHPGAQVYVSQRNRGRSELALGERAPNQPMSIDTLNIWLSPTKPVAAVAIAQLWEAGRLDLDDPVARHVPMFAARGKDGITIRHLLTHTGGFRMLNVGWPKATWDEIINTICSARPEPRWEPGKKAGYHMASSWFMLGEIVRRVSGSSFDRYVREAIFEPLGMRDSWVGMPSERFEAYGDQIGLMHATETPPPRPRAWRTPPHVVGCSPGGNGHGPARDLGRFYEMLLAGGTWGGHQILTAQSVAALTSAHRWGMVDQTFRHELVWGLGFILKSPGDEAPNTASDPQDAGRSVNHAVPYGYGRWASRRVFGHSGAQSSTAFADPEHRLVAVVVANGQPGEARHSERQREVVEAIYRDLGLAPTKV
jgi:CubicO group peptidase (beta-lactamase class C family)